MSQSDSSIEEVGNSKAPETLIPPSTVGGGRHSTSRKRLSDEMKKSGGTNKKIKKMNSSGKDDGCNNYEGPGPINKFQINEENCVRNNGGGGGGAPTCSDIPDKMLTRAQTKLLEAQKTITRQSNDGYLPNNQHVSLKKLLEKEDDVPNYSNTELGRILTSDTNSQGGNRSVTKNKVRLIYHSNDTMTKKS
uniref:WH2 domain-containing protein n=1 Tax=Strongyloides papillosus TaxID=174720 RepID=A0A0N5B742_STREA